MSIRWIIILVIILWLIYEYTYHMWIWQIDSKTIKCGIGVLCIIILLAAPSLENMINHTNIHEFVKQVLINDSHNQFYNYTNETVDSEILKKMQMGASMASSHATTSST